MKLVLSLLLTWSLPSFAQVISVEISRIGDATHLEFKGRSEWNYDQGNRTGNKLTYLLPAFDEATETRLSSWSCPFIEKIEVNKNAPDGKYEVTFILRDNDVESFDYLTDDPSRLIIDFYRQAKPAEKAAAPEPQKPVAPKTTKKADAKNKKGRTEYTKLEKGDRRPAGSELLEAGKAAPASASPNESTDAADMSLTRGIFDGADPNYDRFKIKDYQINENAIIASQQNIYIRFPILKVRSERFRRLFERAPIYEIKSKDTKENKEARFLISLYEKNRIASFLESYDYFQKTYPNSEYDEIVRNLKAEIHIRRYLETNDPVDYEAFRSEYRYLRTQYPDSVLSERNLLLLAYSALDRGDGAEALQDLQLYEMKYPHSKELDQVRLAKAEALVILARAEDALAIYHRLESDAQDKNLGVEAAYRIGDVHFDAKDYRKAIHEYERVMKKYPQFKSEIPNAQYNTGEALFWLGEYKKSLDQFVDFLKTHPAHPHGGFALTRIGELLQILGADQSRVVGAFIESYFRFPRSQGSEVARIRMLSQGLKGMKEKEKRKALSEIATIAKNSTLPRMDEFVTLMVADGLSRRGEYRDSLDRLVTHYQAHPTTSSFDVFRGRILRNISDVMKDEVEKGNYMETLSFYGKYANTWLKSMDRLDIPYFQARAYELSGVYRQAAQIYGQIRDKLAKIKNTKEEKRRKVYENLPTLDQVHLRIAATSLEQRQYREALDNLHQIKGNLTAAENIERVQIGAAVAEQLGDLKQAIAYLKELVKNWEGQPDLLAPPYLTLSRLYLKTDRLEDANKALAEIERLKVNGQTVSDDVWAKALEMRAEYQLRSGQSLAAVETYTRLLEEFESKRPLGSIRYRAGRILYDEGDIKGASAIWAGLDEATAGFYKNLAKEKLEQAEWQANYRKYIDRIPAAKELK